MLVLDIGHNEQHYGAMSSYVYVFSGEAKNILKLIVNCNSDGISTPFTLLFQMKGWFPHHATTKHMSV